MVQAGMGLLQLKEMCRFPHRIEWLVISVAEGNFGFEMVGMSCRFALLVL
jgi:hypothetical protein